MGRSALASALEDIFNELPQFLETLPFLLQDISIRIIFPFIGGLLVLSAFLKAIGIVKRLLYPPSAAELHKEALGELKKGEDQKARSAAKILLKQSIQKDSEYLSSYLTLAALQLYQEDDPKACLDTIHGALVKFPKNPELLQLELDAKAIQENLGHMVRMGAFASAYLGDPGWRPMR